MARNGSGVFTRLYDFTADRDSGSPLNVISADRVDGEFDDISTALTASIAKDGQTTPTADLPMGGFKHTSVATTVSARAQYTPVAVLQDGGPVFFAAAGTDTLTASFSPAIPALVNGMQLNFRAAAANATTTPTFSPNGLTAKTIVKGANTALVAGDIAGAGHECVVRYNSTTDKWHLINPVYPAGYTVENMNSLTTDATGGATGDFIPFVDVSDASATNKVLTTDLFKNVLANFTAKAAPVLADTVMVADSAASGAAKISTLQQVFDAQNALTAKSTPTTTDRIQINDQAASGAAKYSTIANIQTVLTAAQADQETGSSTALFVTPGRQQFHQSAAKMWVKSIVTLGVPSTPGEASYNITSIADTAQGRATFTIATDFSSANWACLITPEESSTLGENIIAIASGTQAAGSVELNFQSETGSLNDPDSWHMVGFGDFA